MPPRQSARRSGVGEKFRKFIASSINAFRCLRLWCGNHPLINNAHCATSFLNLLQGTTFSKLRSSLAGARAHIQSKWQTINSCANDKNQFHFKCRSRPHKLNNFCGAKKTKNFFGIFSHFLSYWIWPVSDCLKIAQNVSLECLILAFFTNFFVFLKSTCLVILFDHIFRSSKTRKNSPFMHFSPVNCKRSSLRSHC